MKLVERKGKAKFPHATTDVWDAQRCRLKLNLNPTLEKQGWGTRRKRVHQERKSKSPAEEIENLECCRLAAGATDRSWNRLILERSLSQRRRGRRERAWLEAGA